MTTNRRRRDTRPSNSSGVEAPDVVLRDIDNAQISQTKAFHRKVKTMKDHRNRIQHVCNFIHEKYPQYSATMVRRLNIVDYGNSEKNFFTSTHDIEYASLSADIVLAFMGTKKNKGDGKIMSHVHIRKYHDALMFGAKEARVGFSEQYYMTVDGFLDNYRKEYADAKKHGNVDEEEADPISFNLFEMVCFWFLCSGNIFAWFFMMCCWNFMARTINVDGIGFRHITKGTDSIKVKYFGTKADQEGKNCTHKNIYANPFNPKVCFVTGMGVYFALNASVLATRYTFFLSIGAKEGTASSNFCRFLGDVIQKNKVIVETHLRLDHANAHGIRKGSGTHSTSCTTSPPSLVAVALRGDWSMGKIFDTYFTFGDFGDQYLGRILAGLNPSKPTFATLPPHFTVSIGECAELMEGMRCMYGPIMDFHPGCHGILLLCLASVVYHSDFLKDVSSKMSGHPLLTLPILNNEPLLQKLKTLVVLESDTIVPSGVPPHVEHMKLLERVFLLVQDSVKLLREQVHNINGAVRDAIISNDLRSGSLSLSTLEVSIYLLLI